MQAFGPISRYMDEFPLTADPSMSLLTAIRMMERYDVILLPVVDAGKFLGVVYQKEIDVAMRFHVGEEEFFPVRDLIRKTTIQVSPEAEVLEVIGEMERTKQDCAVISKNGKLVGVFTLHNVLRLLKRLPNH